jgi:leucyl aminopeptidase
MEVNVVPGNLIRSTGDAVVLSYFEASGNLEGDMAVVDHALGGVISDLVRREEIKGKFKEITFIYTLGKLPFSKIAVVGLGKKSDFTAEKIRVAASDVCKALRLKNSQQIDLQALGAGVNGLSLDQVGQAVTEGALLGTYTFRKHITKAPDYKEIQQVNIIEADPAKKDALEKGIRKGRIIAEGAILARDMVNEPANVINPTAMAEIAGQIASRYGLGIKVFDKEEMQRLGMGGLLGVSQGSQQPPKFIVVEYKGKDSVELDIALIGKGITFDSGGISIKPSEGMGEMKGDMSGGASVLGAIGAIAQLKPKINVAAIVPATENLPSGTAMRPGDIISVMDGKTIEIITTDAEGRLILADALCYAGRNGAKRLVDVATLTGACHMALGDICTGAFGNNQELINKVIAAGNEAGECLWQMPMNAEYREANRSDVADLKNSGGRWGGAITAAWFLGEFVGDIPWVHLDIAGTFMLDKDRGYQVKGATGVPVRTLINLVMSLAENGK